jgi:F-type H+-transporting ATPase subunit b
MSNELLVLLAEIFAFVIILVVLYRFVWPIVGRMAQQRQDAIQQQVEESEEADRRRRQAEERLEKALAEAREEAAMIRDGARADAQRLREELRAQADQEVERIRQRGEEQLVAQRDQIVRRLRAEIGALSLETAERMVVEALSDDDRKRATVDGFLDELEQMTGRAPAAGADARSGRAG